MHPRVSGVGPLRQLLDAAEPELVPLTQVPRSSFNNQKDWAKERLLNGHTLTRSWKGECGSQEQFGNRKTFGSSEGHFGSGGHMADIPLASLEILPAHLRPPTVLKNSSFKSSFLGSFVSGSSQQLLRALVHSSFFPPFLRSMLIACDSYVYGVDLRLYRLCRTVYYANPTRRRPVCGNLLVQIHSCP